MLFSSSPSASNRYAAGTRISGVASEPAVVVTGGGVTTEVGSDDAVFSELENATTLTEGVVSSKGLLDAEFESLTPAVATVDSGGYVSRVSDGTAVIRITTTEGRYELPVPVSLVDPGPAISFVRWVDGSMAKWVAAAVDGMLAGRTANAQAMEVFATSNHAAASYVRNPSLFCAAYASALTGICVWNDRWNQGACGTLITPQHMVGAAHYTGGSFPPGTVYRWVGPDGTVHDRTVTASYRVWGPDMEVGRLDSPLPNDITPVSVPPSNLPDFLRETRFGVPCIARNQFGEMWVEDLVALESGNYGPLSIFTRSSSDTKRREFWRKLVGGDSGGPALMPTPSGLILMTTWVGQSGGPGYHRDDWSAIIDACDTAPTRGTALVAPTGLRPTVADLSSFTNFAA